MKRKISGELRQSIADAAKARWLKGRQSSSSKNLISYSTKPAPRIVAALNLPSLERRAGSTVTLRGRAYFTHRQRLKLQHVDESSASVHVKGSSGNYIIEFAFLNDGEVGITCECPYEDGVDEVICKHKIAAALFLQANYQNAPIAAKAAAPAVANPVTAAPTLKPAVIPAQPVAAPPLWRDRLAALLRNDAKPAAKSRTSALLFFSFIRRNQQNVLQPGVVYAAVVPPELWHDRAALSEYLITHQSDPHLRNSTVQLPSSQLDTYDLLNAPPALHALVTPAAQQGPMGYYNSYNRSYYPNHSANQSPWEALADALVFRGHDQQLIKEPLTVLPDLARVELETRYVKQGLSLTLQLVLPDRTIPLKQPNLEIFQTNPLWLRDGAQIFRVDLESYKYNLLRNEPEVVIPTEAVGEFFQHNFESIARSYPLRGDPLIGATITATEPQPRVYLTEDEGLLRVALRFAYDGYECVGQKKPPNISYASTAINNEERDKRDEAGSPVWASAVKITRYVERENEWWQRLGSEAFGLRASNHNDRTPPDLFVLRKNVHPFEFLKDKVPELAAAGVEVFGEADLTIGRINRTKPTISFNVSSEIDWFDVKTVINFGEIEVSLAEIRRAMRKDRFIKLADGSIGEIPEEWLEKYKHLFGLTEASEDGLRVSRHHVALLDQLLTDQENIKTDKQFEQARQSLKSFQGITEQALPEHFVGELRPYQKAGFDWLHFLREAKFGGCLADDMGTGKTIQTLCFLQSLKENYDTRNGRKRKKEPRAAHLLVVPRSLVTNWEREAEKFAPGLRILNFSYAERAADVKEFDDYDLVLTTYGILLREIERLTEYEFDTVILDEAQAIKNPVSESAKAARLLKARHKLTLTGTPVENNTVELWSQFAFLNPGLLGTADYFREGFANPIERQQSEEATKTLRRLVYPFILRRTKDQVALDLPPRSEKILWGEMEPAQRKLYNETRDEYRAKILQLIEDKGIKDARFRILEGLLRLRQICNDPRLYKPAYKGGSAKLTTLVETIATLQAEGHKALVFSQFVQMLKLIEVELKKSKTAYTYLDGSTTNRQARVDTFQTDENVKLFLISLKAGGVGLNLTAADYVIHVDPWWNPAVEMQATDRAHRIGQDKPVFVYKLLMRDSVEEKILKLQERKRTLVKNLISTEASFFKALTADDIAALFS